MQLEAEEDEMKDAIDEQVEGILGQVNKICN